MSKPPNGPRPIETFRHPVIARSARDEAIHAARTMDRRAAKRQLAMTGKTP